MTAKDEAHRESSRNLWRGSMPGVGALAISLSCALAYAWTQTPSNQGFAGDVEKQWRDGVLGLTDPGAIRFASGDIVGGVVADPQFNISLNSVLIVRRVEAWQYVENCSGGSCKVALSKAEGYVDTSKFKTLGYVNPSVPSSLAFASSAKIGRQSLSPSAVRAMSELAAPYKIGAGYVPAPGMFIVDGGIQNFQGQPRPGSFRVTYRHIPSGVGATVAGDASPSGAIAAEPGRFMAKAGAMEPEDLLGLSLWQLPKFGYALLAACAGFFAVGVAGLWSASQIARQLDEERRKRDRREEDGSDRRQEARRKGQRRAVATPGSERPKDGADVGRPIGDASE